MYCITFYLYQCYSNFSGAVSVVQLVEVTDSAVLGGAVERVSLKPTCMYTQFTAFTNIADLYVYKKVMA